MKKILVTSDFSASANNAVNYAADLAMATQAAIYLVHVVPTPISYSELPIIVGLEDMMRTARHDMDNLMAAVVQRVHGSVQVESQVSMGSFFDELNEACSTVKPYLVVMGSQGKTAAEHFLFGAHATHAVKHLNWPLLTVPPGATFAGIKKMCFASDLDKPFDHMPVEKIKMFVGDLGAELHILNTAGRSDFNADVVFESGVLQEMIQPLNPQFHFLDSEQIDEGIIAFTEKHNVDLLIMMPRRHGFLESLFHKSHTKEMVLHSRIPVLSIH